MVLPIVSIGRLYNIILARVGSYSILFYIKAISFKVSTLYRLIAIFIIFKILVDSSAINNFINSLYFILLEKLISVNNYINIYRGGKFYY